MRVAEAGGGAHGAVSADGDAGTASLAAHAPRKRGGSAVGWRGSSAFLLAVLVFANMVNWADRQVLSILAKSIGRDLSLSDTELGVIGGVAFSLVYAVASFVFGYFADRTSRRTIIGVGLLAWSLATAACGLATGFWGLFAARFLTGIGEASFYPCAMSLVTDGVAANRRGLAVGLLGAAVAFGGGFGIVIGGHLDTTIGWRNVFFVYGVIGVALVPLVLSLVEPARPPDDGEEAVATLRTLKDIFRDARLMWVWSSGALLLAAATGWSYWAPAYFQRELAFDAAKAGWIVGAAQVIGGISGSLLGGWLGDMRRSRRFAGQLDVSAFSALLAAPLLSLVLFQGLSLWVIIAANVLGSMAVFAYLPSLQTSVAELVSPKRLGITFAVHVLFLSGIGAAVGPFAVGWASDWSGSLRVALSIPVVGILVAAAGALVAGRVMRARTPLLDPARARS